MAAALYDKVESQGNEDEHGIPYVTPTEWHHFCARAPLRLEQDIQDRMWDLLAVNNGPHLDKVLAATACAAPSNFRSSSIPTFGCVQSSQRLYSLHTRPRFSWSLVSTRNKV